MQEKKPNAIYISTPLNALIEGYYKENVSIAKIKGQGNFGLGTFNDLDGEMVLLDGNVYQLKSDGKSYTVSDETETPFACVTFFTPHTREKIEGYYDYDALNTFLEGLIPSPNIFYAVRLDGVFEYIRVRSVPRQQNYTPLIKVTQTQPVFEYKNITGTINGFYTPPFMSSINVPGYHFHFLNTEHTVGGHLLECRLTKAEIGVQFIPELRVGLPITFDYLTADLTRDTKEEIVTIEK